MRRFLYLILLFGSLSYAQEKESDLKINKTEETLKVEEKSFRADPFDALAPAKAAFYSAVIPGLGQVYNGSYWKVPIVYGAIGTSAYFYIHNDKEYNRYRDAYKRRLAGFEDDEFNGLLTKQNLIDAQKQFRKNREYSLLFIIGFYILNIVDANVDAHLNQFSITRDLSIQTKFEPNYLSGKPDYGLSLNIKLD
ncbi:MAG: DUF5683 domain-containing protein [Psychroflexus sp.]|uniref:DUF5683 domain-containing protein n=1 Tax=Psychroflexus sp. S27 TaxID=1982757 RepID=UPI000C297ABE|nr:DUF5683 domain-containing protein [Psychroflexus sp. S27]PJX24517.1 hypothetical protein CAP47_03250 [Psychroflexus sp. S27]